MLKTKILDKISIIKKQYDLHWNEKRYGIHPSIVLMEETKEKFFSENTDIQENGVYYFKGLLSLRQWDDLDDTLSKNNENKDKYKHWYVDDFNNFSEFYEFLEELVKDVEKYHHMRINNLTDK